LLEPEVGVFKIYCTTIRNIIIRLQRNNDKEMKENIVIALLVAILFVSMIIGWQLSRPPVINNYFGDTITNVYPASLSEQAEQDAINKKYPRGKQ